MGKKGGSSWLTAVKRAFRSPSKDSEKKSCRRKVDHQQEDEEEKKTERRRWLFRKHSNNNAQLSEANKQTDGIVPPKTPVLPAEQRHAIAVAAATAAAAEAAVATAKAAVEIIRLTQPSNATSFKLHSAAKVIQTAFRGYLARRALIALKGIVKLQALIRGQNVRKQATLTMKCMQTLLRVQARMRDQRARLSHDGGRKSMFAETNNLWESKYIKDIRERKSRVSLFFPPSKIVDANNNLCLMMFLCFINYSLEMEAVIGGTAHVHLKSLKQFSKPEMKLHWLMKSPWLLLSLNRCPSTVTVSSLRSTQRLNSNSSISRYSTSGNNDGSINSSIPNYMAATESAKARIRSQSAPRQRPATPERERGGSGSARKRLSYPIPEPYCVNFGFGCNGLSQNLRSPSFKSVQAGYVGMEEQSNYSCYTESIGGEISPCSTTDLRRWLR